MSLSHSHFSPSHTLPSSLESFPSPKNRKNDRQPTSTGSVNMGGKQPTTTWRSTADLVTLRCVLHSWFLAAIQLLRAQSHPSCVCTAMCTEPTPQYSLPLHIDTEPQAGLRVNLNSDPRGYLPRPLSQVTLRVKLNSDPRLLQPHSST